jgi:hypothetical protein
MRKREKSLPLQGTESQLLKLPAGCLIYQTTDDNIKISPEKMRYEVFTWIR